MTGFLRTLICSIASLSSLKFVVTNSLSPMLFGTLIHETLEDIHKMAIRGETEQITAPNIKDWLMDNYRNLANRERMYLGESTLGAGLS